MKKIPTLFQRDPATHLVINEVTPGCEWVTAGKGVATLKVDGTCCLIKRGQLFKRYELRSRGQPAIQMYSRAPEGFEAAQDPDPVTGDIPGWVPVSDGPEDKYHNEAFRHLMDGLWAIDKDITDFDGTYELLGPKMQGNPYGLTEHILHRHGTRLFGQPPRDFEGIKQYLADRAIEGIVWHHLDGRMAKIKRRDFGLPWPVPEARIPEMDL